MDKMHSLLGRQLKKFFGNCDNVPKELQEIVAAINEAYISFDADRLLLERSIGISSQELLQINSQMRSIFQAIPDLFLRIDAGGKILEYNMPPQGAFNHIPPEEIVGKSIYLLFGPQASSQLERTIRRVFKNKKVGVAEYSIRNQTEIFYEARVVWLDNDQLIVIVRDITERCKAKDALQNSEQRFKQVAECAGDWIWEVNAKGLFTYSSPVAEQVLGYKTEEIVGKKYFYDFFAPEMNESVKKATFDAFNGREKLIGFVTPLIHKNGSTVFMETTAIPVLDNRGAFCGYRGVDRNVTERKKAEQRQSELLEQLESTVTQLNQSNRELKEFAHLAAHDFKTPLRGIGTLAQWLFDDYYDKFDDHGRQQITLLVRRVGRMDKLMNAILQYSTIARNRKIEHPADLNIMFRAALAEIKPPSNIKITTNKDLPIMICEEEHVYQIFYQLLGNAVRFMDKTDGRVTIDYADEDQFWRFSISDNGPGIEQQHFERIFQLFQTLNSRDEAEDTGVGLALVKKIVELYGGRIWLISQPGQGTTFNFTLLKQQAPINPQIPQSTATGQQQ